LKHLARPFAVRGSDDGRVHVQEAILLHIGKEWDGGGWGVRAQCPS
jgi:hypothetical protein